MRLLLVVGIMPHLLSAVFRLASASPALAGLFFDGPFGCSSLLVLVGQGPRGSVSVVEHACARKAASRSVF